MMVLYRKDFNVKEVRKVPDTQDLLFDAEWNEPDDRDALWTDILLSSVLCRRFSTIALISALFPQY